MQFSCVYFKENMSNNLLQENYSAVMSSFVIMVIRLTFCVRKKKGGGGGKNAAIKKKARWHAVFLCLFWRKCVK